MLTNRTISFDKIEKANNDALRKNVNEPVFTAIAAPHGVRKAHFQNEPAQHVHGG